MREPSTGWGPEPLIGQYGQSRLVIGCWGAISVPGHPNISHHSASEHLSDTRWWSWTDFYFKSFLAILVGFEGCLSVRGRGDERTKNNICASLTMFVLLKFNCLSSHCFPTLLQIVSQERAFISSAYHCLLEMFSPLSPGPSLGQMFSSSVMIGCQEIKSTPFLLIIVWPRNPDTDCPNQN